MDGLMNIPHNQPLSADIEDRRNGTTFTQRLSSKVHELMSAVSDDYNDSFGDKSASIPDVSAMQGPPTPGTPAGNAVHAQIHQMLGGTPATLSPDAAYRIRASVSGQ
jgi:hypothetical protein